MGVFVGIYFFVQIVVVIALIISFILWGKRYRKNHGLDIPEGFRKTEEVTIDPSNGKRYRVYYNSQKGERFYHEQK